MACLLGQFYALVDRCAGGNAIQMEQLKRAETKRDPNFSVKFGIGVFEQGVQLVVEANSPDCDRAAKER